MAGHVSFDWDKAVIVVRVPVWHTASSSVEEVELNFCQLAEMLACHFVVNDDKTISGDGQGLVPLAFPPSLMAHPSGTDIPLRVRP